ncbi:hypothetical protein RO3G_00428 [Rhizopus delemar RA 99-880]|uniref:Uncharacterized protein n=1 Tax=Rhizopus delemar (strain RA 99-880 / ATCC MYA-4621 / FGSC 9543 / NRRL 43880) TaxID=246409 RepID=I1BHP4_RHIO9|nr:hypothetical protein RO3G_00428 [Rhizopus delemar RA 99-880]|eukprot:EIE75724.1 hypothetical protein RO3G_00428 [Rhizopus delemar RA 99-880]
MHRYNNLRQFLLARSISYLDDVPWNNKQSKTAKGVQNLNFYQVPDSVICYAY